jgi:hypothetical protein
MRWELLVVVICALLGLSMGAAKLPDRGMPPDSRQLLEASATEAGRSVQLLRVDYRGADLARTIQEQADFLLTPALLVQEVVSDDVVLTYPEE